MRRSILLLSPMLLTLLSATPAKAREGWRGWCEVGNQSVVTSGISSTNKVQRSFPGCVVTVFVHGGGLATIYADNNNTPLANPFQANLDGDWIFFADNGRYDVQTSGANFTVPFTYLDILLCDPAALGACGTLASGVSSITAGATTLTGNITLVAGSNITLTPTSSTSLTISATSSSSGCTLPGTNTGVVSEHPVGTCYDSAHYTWDDGTNKQNMQAGLSNVTGTTATKLTFDFGNANNLCTTASITSCSQIYVEGDTNSVEQSGNASDTVTGVWVFGRNNFQAGNVTDSYLIGGGNSTATGNSLDTDATSLINSVVCLGQGCDQAAGGVEAFVNSQVQFALLAGVQNLVFANGSTTGATIQDVFLVGAFSTVTADDTSVMSSIFKYGEGLNMTASGASTIQDYYSIGFSNPSFHASTQTAVGASTSRYMIDAGFGNTFASSAAHNMLRSYTLGDTNSFTASSGNTQDMFAVGDTLAVSNCNHCFAIGENITLSTSNNISIGLNAVPALVITSASSHDNAQRSPLAFGSLPACAAGTEGSFAEVNDSTTTTYGATITGGSNGHVWAVCNGTNWLVH